MNLPDFSTATPKAIAMDLDETTLNSNARLDERTSTVLHAVHAIGIPMIIATSRPKRVLQTLVGDDILKITSIVQMNGTIALGNAGLTGSFKHEMSLEDACICWRLANEHAPWARMTLEIDGDQFAVNHDDDIDELWAFNIATPTMLVSFKKALRLRPVKISINGMNRNLEKLAIMLENELSSETRVLRAARIQFLNIVPTQASKSSAVANLLESANIPLADVLSFGDDFVDIDLIRDCGWSVAVANAISEIKSLAKYETASNDDHGVAIVLENLVEAIK